MTSTAFITHRDCHLHDMGSHHPENRPARLSSISDHMIAQGLDHFFVFHDAPLATFAQQERAFRCASRTFHGSLRPSASCTSTPTSAMNRTLGRLPCAGRCRYSGEPTW